MTLSLHDVRTTYPGSPPTHALRGVSFEVLPGQVEALIGPNGAGKTTTVSTVMGLVRPDSGTITLDGADLLGPGAAELRRSIGCAPQEEALIPVLSVRDNLSLYAELAGLRGASLAGRLADVADAFLVSHLMDRRVGQLSGGQRRRVHNAIALVARPKVLILDEPTAGVDPATRAAILDVVGRLADEEGVAVCYSTHYLPEVVALGAHVTFLDHGSVIARGSVPDLLAKHAPPTIVVTFDGTPPAIRGATVDGPTLRFPAVDPRRELGAVMASLGPDVSRVAGVDVLQADLDRVFSQLTGRRFDPDADADSSQLGGLDIDAAP